LFSANATNINSFEPRRRHSLLPQNHQKYKKRKHFGCQTEDVLDEGLANFATQTDDIVIISESKQQQDLEQQKKLHDQELCALQYANDVLLLQMEDVRRNVKRRVDEVKIMYENQLRSKDESIRAQQLLFAKEMQQLQNTLTSGLEASVKQIETLREQLRISELENARLRRSLGENDQNDDEEEEEKDLNVQPESIFILPGNINQQHDEHKIANNNEVSRFIPNNNDEDEEEKELCCEFEAHALM